MSNDLLSFIKSHRLNYNYTSSDLQILSSIRNQIKTYSLPYSLLFSRYEYSINPIKERDQAKVISKLLFLIDSSKLNNTLLSFISDIIIKIGNEQIISRENIIIILNYYFFSAQCIDTIETQSNVNYSYLSQFIQIMVKTHNQPCFDLFCSTANDLFPEAIAIIAKSKYLIDLLLFDNSIEFLTLVIKWSFNQDIMGLLINQLITPCYDHKQTLLLLLIQKQLKLLKAISLAENADIENDPHMLMQGFNISEGYFLSKSIPFPNENYVIEFTFNIRKDKRSSNQKILLFKTPNTVIVFYCENEILHVSINQSVYKIIQIQYDQTIHVVFNHTLPDYFFRKNRVDIYIDGNQIPITFNPSYYLKGEVKVKIENFKGQLGKVLVYKQDKSSHEEDIELLIDPLGVFFQYERVNEYILNKTITSPLLCKKRLDPQCLTRDSPFDYISLYEAFNDNEGVSYLLLIMSYLHSTIKQAGIDNNLIDPFQIYNCIKDILELLFTLYKDTNHNWTEPIYAIFYSIHLLIQQIVITEKIPQNLIKLIYEQLPIIANNQLKNNLFMLVINSNNIAISDLSMYIESFPSVIEITNKYTTMFLLQNLIIFYQQDNSPKKVICKIITLILLKSKNDIRRFCLEKILLVSQAKSLYKLLKVFYLTLPSNLKESLSSVNTFNTLNNIFEEHSTSKENYSILLQAIIIRLLDELFIRPELKNTKAFIHQSNVFEVNNINESSNLSQYNIIINRIEKIIDKAQINMISLRSIFLIAFQLTNQKANLDFIKHKTELKNISLINITSKNILSTVFKLVNHLKPDSSELTEYTHILHTFLHEIIQNLNDVKNQKAKDIIESQKIFGDIYLNLIQTKAFTIDKIIKDFKMIINNSFISHSNPFYFNFIYRLTPFDPEATIITPILSIMTQYDYQCIEIQANNSIYLLNNRNLIILFYKLVFYSSIEKKSLFNLIITYLNNTSNHALFYTRQLYEVIRPNQKLFLIEMVIEILIEYYSQTNESDCQLLRQFLLYEISKKEIHTIFYSIDIWDSRNTSQDNYKMVKEIISYEEGILLHSGSRNSYLLLIYFTIKICSLLLKESMKKDKCLNIFLNELLSIIINDINQYNIISKESKKSQFHIEVNDIFYKQFKSKLKIVFKRNQKVTVDYIKNVYDELTNKSPNNISMISYDTCDSNQVEDKQSRSELSISETYSVNKNISDTNSSIFLDFNQENKILSLWFSLIKAKGMNYIHKPKSQIMKGKLGVFFKHLYFNHDHFTSTIQDSFNHFTNYINDERTFLPYPTRIKNYTTHTYIKPFLTLNNKFYINESLNISHSYLNMSTIKRCFINEKSKHHLEYTSSFKLDCELICMDKIYLGTINKYKKVLVIETSKRRENNLQKNILSSKDYTYKHKQIILPFEDISEVLIRRFLYQWIAVEFYMKDNRSYLINLFNKEAIEKLYKLLQSVQLKNKYSYQFITNLQNAFNKNKYESQWKKGTITTFDYLLILNKYSGRTYNDLNQYLIFPWVLSSYKTMKSTTYRQFEYPISIQTIEKRELALEKYDTIPSAFDDYYQIQSHFHSHYSTNAFIYYFLCKLEPILGFGIQFQSGHFDNPNRQFYSIHDTHKIIKHSNDNRELIPELFYLPEMFLNLNYASYGIKEGNMTINNVILPLDCINEEEMIYLHKEILNSKEVGKLIIKWFDNIFGCNQLNLKKDSLNVFPGYSYEQIINKKKLEEETDIDHLKTLITNLGQTPLQLFKNPHSNRELPSDPSRPKNDNLEGKQKDLFSYLTTKNINKQLKSSIYKSKNIKEVLSVIYSDSYYATLSPKAIHIFDIKTMILNLTIELDYYYLFLNINCFIQIKDFSYIICGNFYNKSFKIFSLFKKNEKLSIITQQTTSYIMSIGVGICFEQVIVFYTGTDKGKLAKWCFYPLQKNLLQKESEIIAHEAAIICIETNNNLDAVITSGEDYCVYIRNIYSYEILSYIKVNYIPMQILLFDSTFLYVFGERASGYTLNGVLFTHSKEYYRSCQCIKNKLYALRNNQTMVELNPFDLNMISLTINLSPEKTQKIINLHIIEENKTIDYFFKDKGMNRINLIPQSYQIDEDQTIDNYIYYHDY